MPSLSHALRATLVAISAIFAGTLVLASPRDAAAQSYNCNNSPVCAALGVSDTLIEPGESVELNVNYALVGQPTGPFTDFTMTLEGPDWFHGASFVPNSDWTHSCILDNAPTFRVTCTWTYNTPVVEIENGDIRPGVFPITFVVPAYTAVPDDYDGTFTLTVSATQNGTTHSSTAQTTVNVVGWADVSLVPYFAGGYGTSSVQWVDFDGVGGSPAERGRVVTMTVSIQNRSNGGGPLGTNQLQNALSTIYFPTWWRWVGVGPQYSFVTGNPLVDVVTAPTPGSWGAAGSNPIVLQPAANIGLGTAGTATGWNTRSGWTPAQTRYISLQFFVPCTDLPLDAATLAARDDGSASSTGDEAIYDAVSGLTVEPRTQDLDSAFGNFLTSRTDLFGSCDPSPGSRDKTNNYNSEANAMGPDRTIIWYVRYGAPGALDADINNVRVIDVIPPFTEYRDYGLYSESNGSWNGKTHPHFTRHWHCVLPNAPDRTFAPPNGSAPDANGVPRYYQYTYSEFDPSTRLWNGTTGCVDMADPANADFIEFPAFNNGSYTYEYANASAQAPATIQARQVTHLVFEAPTWNKPDPATERHRLNIAIYGVVTEDDIYGSAHPEGPIPTRAYTLNRATMYGATYDSDNNGSDDKNLIDDLSYGPVSRGQLIDWLARPIGYHHAYADTSHPSNGGNLYARGLSGAVTAGFNHTGAGLVAPSLEVDLPPGFDLTTNERATKTSANWVWTIDDVGNIVEVTTDGDVGVFSIQRVATADFLPELDNTDIVQSDMTLTAVNLGTALEPDWTVTLTFPGTPRFFKGYYSTAGDPRQPFNIGVVPLTTYPFTYEANPSVLTTDATNAEAPHVTTRDLFVTVQEEVQAEIVADCEPGDPRPMLRLDVTNTGGALVTGLRGLAILPTSAAIPGGGTVPVQFRGAEFVVDSWLPNATPQFLEVTTSANPIDPGSIWEDLGTFSGTLADVTAVRAGYDNNEGNAAHSTAPYTGFGVNIFLEHPTATLASIGATLTTSAQVSTTRIPWAASDPAPPFTIGQCPASLTVLKFFDRDANAAQDGAEEALDGWDILAAITVQSPLDATTFGIDTGDRAGTTGLDGTVSFDVWPGQRFTVTETIPAPTTVSTPRPAPFDVGTLSWSATVGNGATIDVALLPLEEHAIGNACACEADSACITGVCEDPTTCAWTDIDLDCAPPADLCLQPGVCDDVTGSCTYPDKDCTPTVIYIELTDGAGTTRWVSCDVTTDGTGTTVDCDRDDDGIADVLPENLAWCGP